MNINNLTDFRTAVEQGKWVWPGGYPCYFICADGEPLSFEAAIENKVVRCDSYDDHEKRYQGFHAALKAGGDVSYDAVTTITIDPEVQP